MIKDTKNIYRIEEKYDITNKDGYVVQSYQEQDRTVFSDDEVSDIKRNCFCDAYLSANNYVKESDNKPLTIYRTLTITEILIQEVK